MTPPRVPEAEGGVKTEFKYIRFVQGRKLGVTWAWPCFNINSGSMIGEVRWYAPWRQFCFFPGRDIVFSAGCLADIQTFIGELSDARKAERATPTPAESVGG